MPVMKGYGNRHAKQIDKRQAVKKVDNQVREHPCCNPYKEVYIQGKKNGSQKNTQLPFTNPKNLDELPGVCQLDPDRDQHGRQSSIRD